MVEGEQTEADKTIIIESLADPLIHTPATASTRVLKLLMSAVPAASTRPAR